MDSAENRVMPRDRQEVVFTKYDRRSLTYANSFDTPLTATIIRGWNG